MMAPAPKSKLTLYALFNASSLCACVAQMPFRALSSRSSTVKLLTMKYLSLTRLAPPLWRADASAWDETSRLCMMASVADWACVTAAGPVGTCESAAGFRRRRQTRRVVADAPRSDES